MAFFRDRTVNLLNLHYGIQSIALSGGGAFFAVYLIEAGVSVAWALAFARAHPRRTVHHQAGRCAHRSAHRYPRSGHCRHLPLGAAISPARRSPRPGSSTFSRCAWLPRSEILSTGPPTTPISLRSETMIPAGPRSACLRRLRPWLASRAPWQQVGPCSRRVPGGNSGPEAVPGGWLDWRGLSFRLANRAVSFAGRKLCRLWRGARPCRTGWHRRGPCARPAYRCRTWAEHSVLRNRRARLDDGLACSGARPCCPCGYRQCARALVVCLYIPTVMAAVHNQAKRSACTLRFHVATEGAWDVGCGSGCLVAALLSALGVLSVAILLSLLGALALFVLLRRYYASHPRDDGRCARSARAERHRQSGRER